MELIEKVTRRLSFTFWKYSIASRLILKASIQISGKTNNEHLPPGCIIMSLNDDFENRKMKLWASKELLGLVDSHGLVINMSNLEHQKLRYDEILGKFFMLPYVNSYTIT